MASSLEHHSEGERDNDNGDTIELETEAEVEPSSSICCCGISTRRFVSMVYLAIVLLLGVVFLVAGKVDTDRSAAHFSENQVYRFLTAMLLFSIVWMSVLILSKFIPDRVRRSRCLAKHEEPAKQLIPRRLLVGILFFGLGSSFMTMVEFLEFLPGYDCSSGDSTMPCYYFVRTVFIYTQLYFFYKLSSSSKKILFFSHMLTTHLIAVNLVTWIVTFVDDSAEELDEGSHHNANDSLQELDIFMARRWGIGINHTTKRNHTQSHACRKRAEDLKSTAKMMEPYFYTFTMEYCLLSAGLLLNVWLSLRRRTVPEETTSGHESEAAHDDDDGGETSSAIVSLADTEWERVESHESIKEVGTLWRFGFIFGLVYVPAFAAIIFNIMFTDEDTETTENKEDNLIYVGFQLFFFLSIFVASVFGSCQLEKQEKKEENEIHGKVDFYLLGGALVGVFFLDMFIIIASFCEVKVSPSIAILLIFTNATELACSVTFTHFVHKALERKVHSRALVHSVKSNPFLRSASNIREVVSFLFMLNICFWAMYTFEVKKSMKVVGLVEKFYTKRVWFYIAHIVYPLAIFFHFHGAVCMVEILNLYSKVPLQKISSSLTSSSRSPRHAVQVHSRGNGKVNPVVLQAEDDNQVA